MKKLIFISLLFLLLFFHPPSTAAQVNTSPALIFSLDQSFGNGIIHQRDTVGLSRVISTLKIFQKYYPTYALLNPMNVDQNKVQSVLNQLEQNSIPFILDAYSSDILTIASNNASVAAPQDISHGIPLSVERLQSYKDSYTQFQGIRIFEVFSLTNNINSCRSNHPEWCEQRWLNNAASPFFDINIARPYIRFAKDNNMFVIWSDWQWDSFFEYSFPWTSQIQETTSQFSNTIVPTYNNNKPNGYSRGELNSWADQINKYTNKKGLGLSDQAWLCDLDHMNCPISELVTWANSAIAQKAKFIEFEPVWYFFSFPTGIVWDPNNYTTDPKWINRGYPTDKLTALAKGLNIIEPLQDIPEPQIGVPTKLFGGTLPTELGNGNGNVYASYVMIENGVYKMWYGGQGNDGHDRIHYAESSNGLNWTKRGVVLDRGNSNHVNDPSVLKNGLIYYMYYTDAPTTELDEIHLATSNDGISWEKRGPAMAGSNSWDKYVGRPSVIYDEGIFKMWYDGRTNSLPGTESKIGYATSSDGFSWTRYPDNPVFTDDAYDQGQGLSQTSAVNIKKIGNQYVMVYQAKGTKWASSTDGIHWQKRGMLISLSGTDFDRLYHATPKIFIDEHLKATAIYMAGVSVPEWNQNSIGIAKLKGDEFVQILSGDLNADGKVDIFDYNILVSKFGHPYTIFDYNQLVANFGRSL